jgi:hypothetical protein
MTLRHLFVIPVLAALASGCSYSLEADLADVEITQHGLGMAGVPQVAQVGDVSVTGAFVFSPSTTAWAKRMNSGVLLHQVRIAAAGSLTDLDFIGFARVTAADPATAESTTEIMNYDRNKMSPAGSAIEVTAPTPVDITSLWSADKLVIELQAAGRLPEQDWTVDVTLKLSGKITCEI